MPTARLALAHRKLMPTYTERLLWGQGDGRSLHAVDTAVGRVGGLICWEHWMPPARQRLHESGEDVHIAAWPQLKEMNLVASRHYAFEGRCFVVAAGAIMQVRDLPAELEPTPDLADRRPMLLCCAAAASSSAPMAPCWPARYTTRKSS